jgi:serine phosphatase RsbU (regulator of sigma subunit)
MFRTLAIVIGGPACAWLVGETVIPSGQPGTNTAFVLAVLVSVIAAGVWWGIVAALISTALIAYFFVEPRGPHLPLATLPVIAVFAGAVAVGGTLARRLAQARDVATASLAERELVLAELARQVNRERDATRAFQSAVLQETLPAVRSATVEAFYRPAVSMYEIGGDWYDVLEHRDGRVTVTVGDIAGKGIPAAAEMVRLSKALRIYAAEGYAPGELLARVDAAMLDGTLREVFATAVCARFDPGALTLEYATAGHPAPLLVRAAGGSVFLDGCTNPPVATGLVRSRSETVQLSPGDSVLFFTDGLIERRHRAIDDGFAELTAICASARTTERALGEIVDTLTATFPAEDDVCIVRLRVNESVPHDPDPTRATDAIVAHASGAHAAHNPAPPRRNPFPPLPAHLPATSRTLID